MRSALLFLFSDHIYPLLILRDVLVPVPRIDQVPSVDEDTHGDRRRIVHLFQTTLHKPVPVHFPKPKVLADDNTLAGGPSD